MVGAALVSGFVITGLASLIPHVTAVDLQINFAAPCVVQGSKSILREFCSGCDVGGNRMLGVGSVRWFGVPSLGRRRGT